MPSGSFTRALVVAYMGITTDLDLRSINTGVAYVACLASESIYQRQQHVLPLISFKAFVTNLSCENVHLHSFCMFDPSCKTHSSSSPLTTLQFVTWRKCTSSPPVKPYICGLCMILRNTACLTVREGFNVTDTHVRSNNNCKNEQKGVPVVKFEYII